MSFQYQDHSDGIYFDPHSDKQESAIVSEASLTVLCTGIQFGKTLAGSLWLNAQLHKYSSPNDNFIVCSPTYKILEQSTLPPLLRILDGYGEYNSSRARFKMHNGGTIYFRTNKDPDSIVGITNVRAIWGDECGKYTLYHWENIQARASFFNAPIMLTTSPYTLNWLYREIIRPYKQGLRPEVNLIEAASIENPYFSKEAYESKKKTMDPRRFAALYGGEFSRMEGLVYDCFSEDDNIVQPFLLPEGTIFVAGVDWGYTEPAVVVVRAITPDQRHYQVSETYRTKLNILELLEICKHKQTLYNIKKFYCGHDRPENIQLFQKHGLLAEGVAERDIQVGTDLHYELIKSRRYKIFAGSSPHTLDELDLYHYPEPKDLASDQNSQRQAPVGQDDHSMSANRFITLRTYDKIRHVHKPRVQTEVSQKHEIGPFGKQETLEEKLKRLRKLSGKHDGSENWT